MSNKKTLYFPITINEEDGIYWWEAKFFDGCFSQWNSLDDYWNNMTQAISSYSESIKDWSFDMPNTGILWINLDDYGKIKDSVLKRIDKNSYKALSSG